jgi:hypothetical protein
VGTESPWAHSRDSGAVLTDSDLDVLYKLIARDMGIDYNPDDNPPENVLKKMKGVNKNTPWVREMLGLDSGEAIMYEPADDPPAKGFLDWDKPIGKSYADRMLEGDPARFEDHPEHVPSTEKVDYSMAVERAMVLTELIKSSDLDLDGQDKASSAIEAIFRELGGDGAASALWESQNEAGLFGF